jgi:hypothetical protein
LSLDAIPAIEYIRLWNVTRFYPATAPSPTLCGKAAPILQ